jgi:hypothetical protein
VTMRPQVAIVPLTKLKQQTADAPRRAAEAIRLRHSSSRLRPRCATIHMDGERMVLGF